MLRLVLIVSLAVTAFGARLPSRHFVSGGRIAGGENATIQEVPYQVAILWNNYFNCGGSILSATVIISSAQCVIAPPNLYKVRAGTNQNANGVGQTVDVSSYIVHDQFDPLELDYDISLLFLSTALNLDGVTMAPIALPSQGQTVADGTSALTSGWGALAVDGSFPTTLQKVSIPIFNQASCLTIYEEMEWPVSDRMICAGLDEGGKDSCQGDTGGPLVINSQLIGITSWGLLCAFPGYPGVWTRVPFFVDWINQNAGL